MKIIFICGSLEPGKNGVGDYTRRLACDLIVQGVPVGIIGLKDKYVSKNTLEEQFFEETSVSVLRIPYVFNCKKRVETAKAWINLNNPEWLSLQYVIYSFHDKGLPLGLASQLKKIGRSTKWHIMFHETWLGMKTKDSFKYQIIGEIQKLLIKSIRNSLDFKVVHTHTQFYLRELKKLNFQPLYLPIFSNIPIIKNESSKTVSKTNEKLFVIFGNIHPRTPLKAFSKEFSNYFNLKKNIKGKLVIIGQSGSELEKWVNKFESFGIEVNVMGEKSAEDISEVLQNASYGITTNPTFVVEKSGTVAAMREHNLRVLVVAENTLPKDNFELQFDSDLFEFKAGNFTQFMNMKTKIKDINGLRHVSKKFLRDLGFDNINVS